MLSVWMCIRVGVMVYGVDGPGVLLGVGSAAPSLNRSCCSGGETHDMCFLSHLFFLKVGNVVALPASGVFLSVDVTIRRHVT